MMFRIKSKLEPAEEASIEIQHCFHKERKREDIKDVKAEPRDLLPKIMQL
jgi:hypothetical protein